MSTYKNVLPRPIELPRGMFLGSGKTTDGLTDEQAQPLVDSRELVKVQDFVPPGVGDDGSTTTPPVPSEDTSGEAKTDESDAPRIAAPENDDAASADEMPEADEPPAKPARPRRPRS